ncbi:TPA: hypothetical protein MD287_002720 [Klebsiella aerogenes]|nr:hypothetical protein [Klebsiella aerogenes]
MLEDELKKICVSARIARDKTQPLPDQHLCKETSLAICYSAAEIGMNTCLCQGKFRDSGGVERDHYWVRIEGVIYDATADQFDECLEPVYITAERNDSRYQEECFVIFNETVIKILKNMK